MRIHWESYSNAFPSIIDHPRKRGNLAEGLWYCPTVTQFGRNDIRRVPGEDMFVGVGYYAK